MSLSGCVCVHLAVYVNGLVRVRVQSCLCPKGRLIYWSTATEDFALHTKHVHTLTNDLPQWLQRLASRRAQPYTICHVACP